MSNLGRQTWRFLMVGGANTTVSVVLLALLALVLPVATAYTIVFALGLAFSTMMTSRFVFSTAASWTRTIAFAAWYLGVYVVGLVLVRLLDGRLDWPPLAIALATVAVTAPLSFLGGRLLFHRKHQAEFDRRELTR